MGLDWAGMDPATIDFAAVAEEMRPVLYGTFNARVAFYAIGSSGTPYDPEADSGGASSGTALWDTGENGALVTVRRGAARVNHGGQNLGVGQVEIQVKAEAPLPLRSGMIVKVLDGGQAKFLESYVFSLDEGIDSSSAWGQILEATVVTGG